MSDHGAVAAFCDACDGVFEWLICNGHVMGVGVEQGICVDNPCNMAFPEEEIAARRE